MTDNPDNANITEKKSPLKEIIQPFIDLIHAPRALWGINLAYVIEGMVYFGMLGYLSLHFSDYIFQGMPNPNELAHDMVMVLTAGITIAMLFLGTVADKKGVRFALIAAFCSMIVGRVFMSAAPTVFGFQPNGLWSSLHLVTMVGIVFVVIGYGMYQPAAYAAVRQFTTPKTAGMGFAMLYALMNLGGWLPSFAFLLRDDDFAGFGIVGTFWVYTAFTVVALVLTIVILTPGTVKTAIQKAKEETAKLSSQESEKNDAEDTKESKTDTASNANCQEKANTPKPDKIPIHLLACWLGVLVLLYWRIGHPNGLIVAIVGLLVPVCLKMFAPKAIAWIARHALADLKFFCFIFALIPVQTLFTYNWLVLPQYISRSFSGFVGDKFEFAANLNPILIFILVPIIAALTQKAKVYTLMIVGTTVMAAPAFLLAWGPYPWALFTYIFIMTIGEAMWQPRFLQYAAQIAPEGRTGEYMGVSQLPWFLTKVLVPLLYSGWMMDRYCPADGAKNTETMWFIFACIAMLSPLLLLLGKKWLGQQIENTAA